MATIPFNLVFCLFVGLCFTACARTQLLGGAQPWRREMGLVLSFAVFSAAPVATYYYLAYPDWSWMYIVPPRRLPYGTGLAVVVVTTLMVPVGYLLGWSLLRLFRERGLFASLGVFGMGMVLLLAFLHRRAFYLGRYEDFQSGGLLLRPITHSKLAFALLCTSPLLYLAAALTGWSLWGYGRWLRQQAASVSMRTGDHIVRPTSR